MILTVIVLAYNQEKYIAQTLCSVMKQRTSFELEYIVADDCSTDKTVEIINKIIEGKSNVTFIKNRENLGLIKNYAQCMRLAKGKYIADIGGDDIWLDQLKLQKEVDFLESHPDFGMVHTQFDVYLEEKGIRIENYLKNPIIGEGQELYEKILKSNTICSITACYRVDLVRSLIEDFETEFFSHEDTPMWLEIAQNKKIGYLENSTSLYRLKKGSVSKPKSTEKISQYNLEKRKVRWHYMSQYPVSADTEIWVRQQEAIEDSRVAYLKENKVEFMEKFKKIHDIPRRIWLMRIIMASKILIVACRPLKWLIYKGY
ncbi:glycosyltransferase family 2 protein [Saccharicrinis sp. GN24d3]|uniref:glycosyltransferase family 2 protein n=1 Tax=Saccharicrinis sp. GN24d3 TaxID=3458416 RepID=UPI0040372C52